VTELTEERAPRTPARTCAGCAREDDAEVLVRLVRGPSGEIAVDVGGGGRGSYVHARTECIVKACKGGLARSFRAAVSADAGELAEQIATGSDRRIRGLILSANRLKRIALGADAACEALQRGPALVVVATDAGSIARKHVIVDAIASGNAIAWGDKASLGSLVGGQEVAALAVTDTRIASALRDARRVMDGVSDAWARPGLGLGAVETTRGPS
jgi:predicted RNA-binding protein YlxR (DUF448 family)/ribosomal protein L7Ae-like RNA K-turn-binding protein